MTPRIAFGLSLAAAGISLGMLAVCLELGQRTNAPVFLVLLLWNVVNAVLSWRAR